MLEMSGIKKIPLLRNEEVNLVIREVP